MNVLCTFLDLKHFVLKFSGRVSVICVSYLLLYLCLDVHFRIIHLSARAQRLSVLKVVWMFLLLQYVYSNTSYLSLIFGAKTQTLFSHVSDGSMCITFTSTFLLSSFSTTRPDLVQILVGHNPEELEPVLCQLLCGQRWRLPALQDLEVCWL